MTHTIDAATLKSWLSDGREIAFFDVREHGQYGEGHPFFAVPLPYSRFEIGLPLLAPNRAVRLVLLDDGDGVAERAAARGRALGYTDVSTVRGGAAGWLAAGYTLFAGVNVPSKTFGELIEHRRGTPRICAEDLKRGIEAGDNIKIFDGRPFAEYNRMSIPGGVCCPNGELALHLETIAADPDATIVVNCAGRTRSIIGAETLRDLGISNPVVALENGTQGWFLAGLELARGADRQLSHEGRPTADAQLRAIARALAERRGVGFVAAAEVNDWLADHSRSTFLLDVRTAEEYAAGSAPGLVHAPGGQLIQATDQWVGVKGARLVLVDAEMVRAAVVAGWLAQLGHQVAVLEGGIAAASELINEAPTPAGALPHLPTIGPRALADNLVEGSLAAIDLRPSMDYRKAHIPGALWSIRPRLGGAITDPARPLVLIADDLVTARLAALDLAAFGVSDVRLLDGGQHGWTAAGLPVEASPAEPADEACIDYLFFVHDRHDGNADAARQYLAWETGLLAQLDDQERGVFRIVD